MQVRPLPGRPSPELQQKKREGINALPSFTSYIRSYIQTTQASWMFFISQSPPAFSTKSSLSLAAK